MKKTISIILALVMMLSLLCSCGEKPADSGEKTDDGLHLAAKTLTYKDLCNIDWGKYIKTLGDYSKITLDMYPDVTDDDIQAEIDALIDENVEYIEVDREAKEGDTLDISYVGTIDGTAFEGGTADNQIIVLGASGYIDGFDDGLIGAKKGEVKTLNLKFPENYGKEELNGKDCVFTVTVNKVSEEKVPEFTEDFVKSKTEYKSIDEYKAATRLKLEKEAHSSMVGNKGSYAFQELYKTSELTGEYPENLYEKYYNEYVDYYVDYYTKYAEYYSLSLDEFLKTYMQKTHDEFIQLIKSDAEKYSKDITEQTIILFKIAIDEGLLVKDEEYSAEALEYAKNAGFETVEDLEKEISKDDICVNLTMQRAVNVLAEKAAETGTYSDGTTEPATAE